MPCDFHGNDLSNVQIPLELCRGKCAETPECTHFTWTKYNGGTCWMKKGCVSIINDTDTVYGIIKNRKKLESSTSSSSFHVGGTTSRFWDCCKPSCAWPKEVSGNNDSVRSCHKDGYTILDNNNVRSGCGGGGGGVGVAFACNKQKPWVVNEKLAYGFAAASIPGLKLKDLCCTCYELFFKSGPVQGKQMIVQVINSGSDIHPHQFDLQIPGGGVGLFNGCTSQWNSPRNGWGQVYGGVSSRQECYSLPVQIQDGCFFRFDWFRGDSNPKITYSKVECPAALVAITGCSRQD